MKFLKALLPLLLVLIMSRETRSQNSLLWEVTHPDTDHKSYIFGTLKFIGEQEYYLPNKVTEVLNSCRIFTIEDQVDHHAQHELNKKLHFGKKESLQTVLTAEQYQKVKAFFATEFGIDGNAFEKKYARLKPLALSIAMTRLSLKEEVKFYDIELLKMAKQNGLEAYSLEEIEREATALNAFAMDDQVRALMHSIENFSNQKNEYLELEKAFTKGDIDRVFELTVHPFENNETFIEEFYHKRNREWVPKMKDMMLKQPSFLALGVAHLEGDQSILSLLRKEGFTLSPVPLN